MELKPELKPTELVRFTLPVNEAPRTFAAASTEMTYPELSNAMRTNIALLHEATSSSLAKIPSWFDQTIDRIVDRFTMTARKAPRFLLLPET